MSERNTTTDCPPLRVGGLIFGSLKSLGGYQVFTYNLLHRLAQRGHDVRLFLPPGEYGKNTSFYDRMLFDVAPLPLAGQTLARLRRFCPGLLRAWLKLTGFGADRDVWQVVGTYPAAYVAGAFPSAAPTVLRAHGDDIQVAPELSYGLRLDPRLEKRLRSAVAGIDRLVAMTPSMADCYRELDADDSAIVQIPNGVDVERYGHAPDRQATRRKWGLPADCPVCLTVGRHHRKKGYDLIPPMARQLRERGVEFCWLIVGDGTEVLTPLIEQHAVGDVVRTAPGIKASLPAADGTPPKLPADDLVELYQCADAFVFPSYLEGFPRVLIEGMAAGLPVVTTDAPGCGDVVQHERTGLVAPAGDVDALAEQTGRILTDDALRQRLTAAGLEHVKQYDWDVVVDQYEELYRSLLR